MTAISRRRSSNSFLKADAPPVLGGMTDDTVLPLDVEYGPVLDSGLPLRLPNGAGASVINFSPGFSDLKVVVCTLRAENGECSYPK